MYELYIGCAFLVWIFFSHTIADYVFQTRWMAENKSTSLYPLLVHIAEYTFVMFLFMLPILGIVPALTYAGINGGLHLVTDFFTSKMSKWSYENGKMKYFWAILGFDQFIHLSCLIMTLPYALSLITS